MFLFSLNLGKINPNFIIFLVNNKYTINFLIKSQRKSPQNCRRGTSSTSARLIHSYKMIQPIPHFLLCFWILWALQWRAQRVLPHFLCRSWISQFRVLKFWQGIYCLLPCLSVAELTNCVTKFWFPIDLTILVSRSLPSLFSIHLSMLALRLMMVLLLKRMHIRLKLKQGKLLVFSAFLPCCLILLLSVSRLLLHFFFPLLCFCCVLL